MHQNDINGIDLNLLKALGALLDTVSVSKAGERINLSQPAMSRALNRLQQVMKDPLLVRSGRGMVLTPRAETLKGPVQETLAGLAGLFQPHVFDPALSRAKFRIMVPDYLALKVLPNVLGQAFTEASHLTIEMEAISERAIADMSAGHLHLGFGVVQDGPALDNLRAQALFDDQQVCLMRKGHPLAAADLDLEQFSKASHALLSITGKGGGRIDDILQDHGLQRHIALRMSQFLSVSTVIAASDLLITVPNTLAKEVMTKALMMKPLPTELRGPAFTVSQIWHERFTQDPAHQWLRRLIKTECRKLKADGM